MAAAALPEALVAAVKVVFGEWTALKLAVENEWGGGDTREKALGLLERTLAALNAPQVHADEVEGFFSQAGVRSRADVRRACKWHVQKLASVLSLLVQSLLVRAKVPPCMLLSPWDH